MATIKFSEFDAGNINAVGAQIVGLEGGNNKRFTASDLVNGLATVTYVDAQDTGLQSQITQNTNDIASIDLSGLESNVSSLQGDVGVIQGQIVTINGNIVTLENSVSVNSDDIVVLRGNIVALENEVANIADTDAQTLTYDGATANLSISNGNNVILQEVLDNAGNISSAQTDIINLISNQNSIALNVSNNSSNITVIQGQISDLQANGNIQTLSLDNSSNVLSISGGNTVDFTTVLGNVAGGGGGLAAVVDDTSPQLGGTLNSNGFNIELSSASPVEFGIEWNDGSGTKYGDIVAQPDSNEFEISSGSGARDLVLVGDRDIEIKTGLLGRDIIIGDLIWPSADGSAGQVLQTDGAGNLSFGAGGGSNPFDQDLNTTDDVTFNGTTINGNMDVNGAGTHAFQGTIEFTQIANFGGTVGITALLDEDNMVSDSATALATQQSIKAYVDAKPTSGIAIGNVTVEPTAAFQSIAIGEAADASVAFAIAIGKNSSAPNNFGIAIGENTTVGVNSVALGYNADASTNYTTALGWSAVATGPASTALGHECEATGSASIAMGSDSTASSSASMAIGYKSDVQAAFSTSIGHQNDISTTGSYTISIGNYLANNTYTEPNAIKIAAGSTYQTQVEVRPNYLDLSSTGFGIACNASVGFTFTDAVNGNVTLSSLVSGGTSYGIDESSRSETTDWLKITDNGNNRDVLTFRTDSSADGSGNYGSTTDNGHYQFLMGTVNQRIMLEAPGNNPKITGWANGLTGDTAGLTIEGRSFTATEGYLRLEAGSDQAIEMVNGSTTINSANATVQGNLTADSGIVVNNGTVRLANLTTTERNALTAGNGDMIYNVTDSKLQGYQAGVWINLDGS